MTTIAFIITIFVVLLGLLSYAVFNLLKKVETYEDKIEEYQESITLSSKYINEISKAIRLAENQLAKIDAKGTFKSDDEVGFFFKYIQEIQGYLNVFDLENIKQIKKAQAEKNENNI